MRKILAIALLAFLSLPLLPQLQRKESLPACCRRNGAHHCMMQTAESQHNRQVHAPVERCPYCPAAIATAHSDAFVAPTAQAVFAELVAHPASPAQTESKLLISRNRSRQKRGPPSFFSI
ncbi:MAG TPA: hypothetical protein VHB45_01525 [Alloacidobacterium sp.]|nr:hypothetical protein [Alloacidobacterium sp.]